MKHILLIALMGIITAFPALAQNNNDEQELIRLDKEWGMASMKGDAAVLNRIYADDYTTRSPEGARNKQQVVEEIVKDAANLKNPVYTSDNYSVRFIGSDTAVMTHTGVASGEDHGKAFRESHHGQWQAAASQVTRVAQQTATK
jgi:hypothetical protein